jgi:hypothetical protein
MVRPASLLAFAVALAAGCAGPPIPAPIEGLPVCPDFTTGNAKMEGGLRHPIRLRVLDGKNVLYNTTITGLRRPDDPKPKSFISDDNAKYTVEWSQCGNPRAPRPVSASGARPKGHEHPREEEGGAYECGEANVYKPDGVLETKKHDRASHVITFLPAPDMSCWTSDAAAPEILADAGAPPVVVDDAGAAVSADAGVKVDAGVK